MNNQYKYILLVILAVGTIACNKNVIEEEVESNGISFEVFTGITYNYGDTTKGIRYNSEDDFKTQTFGLYAWDAKNVQIYNNEPVSKTGDVWKPTNVLKWKDTDSYVFEAVYPKPASSFGDVGLTALSTSSTPGDLTFSYTIPTTTLVDADKDFMLAYYSGLSNEGAAPLTFTHPLTCVNFNVGKMDGIARINFITISGAYASGSGKVRLSEYYYNDTKRQCYSYEKSDSDNTSLWTPSGSTSVKGASTITLKDIEENALKTIWDYNFLLIPQNTASQNATLTLNITATSGETYNVSTIIKTDYWRAGYTNTYKINYTHYNIELDPVVVTPWEAGLEKEITLE